jgi:dipeptidyl-peptidase III
LIIANRIAAECQSMPFPFIEPAEAEAFTELRSTAWQWWFVLHDLVGRGLKGKMMAEIEPGKHNFDVDNPPLNPLTGKPITTWYKPCETYQGKFGDLAVTLDQFKAELVASYLISDLSVLETMGFTGDSTPSAVDRKSATISDFGSSFLDASSDV